MIPLELESTRSPTAVADPACGRPASPPYRILGRAPRQRPRILLAERPAVPLVYFSWVAPAGIRHEPDGREGLAALACRDLASRHGELVVGLDRDCAVFGIGGLVDEVAPRLEALLDAVLAPRIARRPDFGLATYAEERSRLEALERRLLAEQEARRHHPETLAEDVLSRSLLGAGPDGRPPLGNPASLARITAEDLWKLERHRLSAEGCALLAAGDFEAERLADHLEHVLPTLVPTVENLGTNVEAVPVTGPSVPENPRSILLVDRPEAPYTVVRTGWPSVPAGHPDFFALCALADLLAGPSSSRLARCLRDGAGTVYKVEATLPARRGPAPLSLVAALPHHAAGEVLDAFRRESERLCHEPVGAVELEGLRTYRTGRLLCRSQTLLDTLGRLRRHVLDGGDPVERELTTLAELEPAGLRALASRHLAPAHRVEVVVGPACELRQALAGRGVLIERKLSEIDAFLDGSTVDRSTVVATELDVRATRNAGDVSPLTQHKER